MLTVPESLEGWCLLHQMFRVSWPALVQATDDERAELAAGLQAFLEQVPADGGSSIAVAMLGHKADLMLVHARKSFDALVQAQLDVSRLPIAEAFEATTSYVSVIELGMYEMTAKIHEQLVAQRARARHPASTGRRMREAMQAQQARVSGRLFTDVPGAPVRLLLPDGQAPRRDQELVQRAVREARRDDARSRPDRPALRRRGHPDHLGSIGFDDWEWGVDLFADDPLVFKKLIYEMRFDEASADYGEFGPFYTGVQFSPSQVTNWIEGRTPALAPDA